MREIIERREMIGQRLMTLVYSLILEKNREERRSVELD